MFDPYATDSPGINDPSQTIYVIQPNDAEDIPYGIKQLRIFNPTAGICTVAVLTVGGNTVFLKVPPQSLTYETIRIKRLLEASTTPGMEFHGYTDAIIPPVIPGNE